MIAYFRKILIKILNTKQAVSFKYTPRWVVLLFELCIVSFGFFLNFLIIKTLNIDYSNVYPLSTRYLVFISFIALMFVIFGTHRASLRFTGISDIIWLSLAMTTATVVMMFVNVTYFNVFGTFIFRFIPLFYASILSIILLIIFRLIIKFGYLQLKNSKSTLEKQRMLMLGTSEMHLITAKGLNSVPNSDLRISGYIGFDPTLKMKNISSLPVFLTHEVYAAPEKYLKNISGVIILDSIPIQTEAEKFLDFVMSRKIEIYTSNFSSLHHFKEKEEPKLKKVEIEDLLFRKPIEIDTKSVNQFINNKRVLVTGAAGSIGSELVRQICSFYPSQVIMLDMAETPLFYIEQEITDKYPQLEITSVLGNILDPEGMEFLFERYRPEVVFHAAAYKHVPMMEKNPEKSFWVNLMGSKSMADLSLRYGVQRMVQISTDKAVNPTNIMGLTKRLAELYIQNLYQSSQINDINNVNTQFVVTRFGNVLGSNGSVIPIFRKQISERKPITITDPSMTRYFMTIPEASSLVLQAGTKGKNGEIFIFDMGQPVKIIDMAKRLIRLSGLEPGKDIEIKVMGKRPGEKLHEELFNENCLTVQTDHPKVFKVLENKNDQNKQINLFERLFSAMKKQNLEEVLVVARELVPEFKHEKNEVEVKVG